MSDAAPLTSPDPAGCCRIVVVDDSEIQCSIWKMFLEQRFGSLVQVETYSDPRVAVDHLNPDIQLLLLDWEMPGLDGRGVLEIARQRGVDLKRIVVASCHPADVLHEVFDSTGCLAVIEKEPAQLAACGMILDDLVRRQAAAQAG